MITPTQIRKIAAAAAFTTLTAGSLATGTGLASAGVADDARGPHTPTTSAATDAAHNAPPHAPVTSAANGTHRNPFAQPNTHGGQHSHDQGR